MKLLLVFLGGGLGASARWLVGRLTENSFFPFGTLTVNLLGCLAIGLLSVYLLNKSDQWFLFAIVGFLGGFTTFSSFGFELFDMLKAGRTRIFFTYLMISNVLGVGLVYIGHEIGRLWVK